MSRVRDCMFCDLVYYALFQNESVMQAELVSRGPLSVLINAQELQFYHSGVWDPKIFRCDPTDLDHGKETSCI